MGQSDARKLDGIELTGCEQKPKATRSEGLSKEQDDYESLE